MVYRIRFSVKSEASQHRVSATVLLPPYDHRATSCLDAPVVYSNTLLGVPSDAQLFSTSERSTRPPRVLAHICFLWGRVQTWSFSLDGARLTWLDCVKKRGYYSPFVLPRIPHRVFCLQSRA